MARMAWANALFEGQKVIFADTGFLYFAPTNVKPDDVTAPPSSSVALVVGKPHYTEINLAGERHPVTIEKWVALGWRGPFQNAYFVGDRFAHDDSLRFSYYYQARRIVPLLVSNDPDGLHIFWGMIYAEVAEILVGAGSTLYFPEVTP